MSLDVSAASRGRLGNQVARSGKASDNIHGCVPGHDWKQATVGKSHGSEQYSQNHAAHETATPLVKMCQPKEARRYHDRSPCRQSHTRKHADSEAAIQKFFANSRSNGERKKKDRLTQCSRKDSLGECLDLPARFGMHAPYAAQVQPLKRRQKRRAKNSDHG